uniref:Uncharacterized protein n=1 Tax=Schistocephalus solidus TaxID=70667 RepID=A0A0V0J1B2_SCHSO
MLPPLAYTPRLTSRGSMCTCTLKDVQSLAYTKSVIVQSTHHVETASCTTIICSRVGQAYAGNQSHRVSRISDYYQTLVRNTHLVLVYFPLFSKIKLSPYYSGDSVKRPI